ncbi:hypothetical protein OESDEN_25274 [Oesophagostomum dentatum]|uniref:Uncharacterized protein n=1 Tax=Oesophagostomum dentatum TaxID=61180 RepID=A0A0B1RVN6_OESDE|nr:hypothetical protein OESDEN_25274 [Oesophagostomum dentatum]
MEVGRAQFRHRYGRDYNHDCDDDRALITGLWEPVKEMWDKKVKSGEDLRGLAREFGTEANANISVIRRGPADRRPPNYPLPIRSCESVVSTHQVMPPILSSIFSAFQYETCLRR